jgi:hypothetical protein
MRIEPVIAVLPKTAENRKKKNFRALSSAKGCKQFPSSMTAYGFGTQVEVDDDVD